MFSLRRPTPAAIRRFVAEQSRLDLTYAAIGATRGPFPPDYSSDHVRVRLGSGAATFSTACAALRRWEQFDVGWVEACDPTVPLEPGRTVSVLAHAWGLWSLNACRIVYVVAEQGTTEQFGFAYGTLPDHIEFGEERFLIEWEKPTDSVWYDVRAFFRPRHPLVRGAWPLVHPLVNRFRSDSARRMLRAVAAES